MYNHMEECIGICILETLNIQHFWCQYVLSSSNITAIVFLSNGILTPNVIKTKAL